MNVPASVSKARIVVYLCGGAGLNTSKAIQTALKSYDTTCVGEIQLVMIDTADSNLPEGVKKEDVYIIKTANGRQGSGKIRIENSDPIVKESLGVLQKYAPGDLSIVVSSLGGGSGSVIAPVLMSHLLSQNKLAVAVGITCNDTLTEVTNTIRTLESYEGISSVNEKPVPLSLHINTNSSEFEKVNTSVASMIMMLATLASGQNQGLDSSDLYNWINYHRVSDAPAKLVTLDVVTLDGPSGVENDLLEGLQPITVATLARQGANTKPHWTPDYQCVGVLPAKIEKSLGLEHPLHFVLSDGYLERIYKRLREQEDELVRARAARNYSSTLLNSSKAQPTKNGLVF